MLLLLLPTSLLLALNQTVREFWVIYKMAVDSSGCVWNSTEKSRHFSFKSCLLDKDRLIGQKLDSTRFSDID